MDVLDIQLPSMIKTSDLPAFRVKITTTTKERGLPCPNADLAGWVLADPLAVAVAIQPEIAATKQVSVKGEQ